MRLRQIAMLLVLCALLAGCGNKGPLVLPDKSPQAQPTTTPAPPQGSGKQ